MLVSYLDTSKFLPSRALITTLILGYYLEFATARAYY
jgi:hypothetical protein